MKQGMNEIKLNAYQICQLKYARQHKYPPVSKYPLADAVGYS